MTDMQIRTWFQRLSMSLPKWVPSATVVAVAIGMSMGSTWAQAMDPFEAKLASDQNPSQTSTPTKSAQWDMGFHPVIWEGNYKLGLGLSGGLRYYLHPKLELGGDGAVTYFRVRIDGFEPVTEIGGRVFGLHSFDLNVPFLLKLGAAVGGYRLEMENWYVSVAGVAEASFSFVSPWGLYLQFSPGYLIGENSQGIFRLGIGTTYNIGGANGRAPKEKLRPPERETSTPAKSEIDFGGTMVPLPEPEPPSADEQLLNSSEKEKH